MSISSITVVSNSLLLNLYGSNWTDSQVKINASNCSKFSHFYLLIITTTY
jgi:hypothetical protein